jgi:hypothetical protein
VHPHSILPNTVRGYAKEAPIKLWRRNDTAFTFLATLGAMKQQTHLEFYVTWFKHDAEIRDGRTLILRFNRPCDINLPAESSEKQHKRKLSFASKEPNGKAPRSETSTRRGSGQEPPRLHNGPCKVHDTVEFVKKNDWCSLEIHFTHDEGQPLLCALSQLIKCLYIT